MVGRDNPDGHDVFGRDNHGVCSHCHDRIEIAGGQRVREIALVIGKKGVDQSKICTKRGLQQIGPSAHLDLLFALFNDRADAGWRENAAQAAATGANPFHQRTLRNQLD